MNNFMKKYVFVFCLMFFSSLSFAGLAVSPSVVNVSGVQGSSCKGSYTVTNKGEESLKVSVNLLNGNSFSENKDLNVEDWLKFETTEFNLEPEEKKDIPFEVFISSDMKGSVCGKVSFFVSNYV